MLGEMARLRAATVALALLIVTFVPLIVELSRADTLDPCSGEGLGASTVDNHVCLDAETIKTVNEDMTLENAEETTEGDMTYVSFTIQDHGRWTVMQLATETELSLVPSNWTDPLPAGELDLSSSVDEPLVNVHLSTPMTPYWQDKLEAEGVDVLVDRPGNWVVANVSQADDSWVGNLAFVDGVRELDHEALVDDRLDDASGEVNVTTTAWLPEDDAFEDACKAVLGQGGTINQAQSSPDTSIIAARINASNISALAENSAIAWVQPGFNGTKETMDNIRSVTGAQNLHSPAQDSGYTGEDVTGMVVTSDGMDEQHEELNSSVVHYHDRNRDYFDGCSTGTSGDFVTERLSEAADDDSLDHGSATFGITYADGNHSDGDDPLTDTDEKKIRGMAPNASGVVTEQLRLQRYQQVRDEKASHDLTFASYSWVYTDTSFTHQTPAYTVPSLENDLIVAHQDTRVFQSMANDGPGQAATSAIAKNAVAVGGLYHKNNANLSDDHWWGDGDGQASTGPSMDGRIKPDLVGPYDSIITTRPGNNTGDFGGTSGATPVVAGAGALVEEMHREGEFMNKTSEASHGPSTPALTKALLVNSAHTFDLPDHSDKEGEFVDVNNTRHVQGWGQPNVSELEEDAASTFVVNGSVNMMTGDRYEVTYDIPDNTVALRVSLAWTDPPTPPVDRFANTSADASALVNDLDLEVEAPSGTMYVGNGGLFEDNRSDAANTESVGYPVTGADRVNNVENVFLTDIGGETGEWVTTVKASAVPFDMAPGLSEPAQPFGLVVRPLLEVQDDDGSDGGGCGCGGGPTTDLERSASPLPS
jgi:hypothetical protein